MVPYQHWYVFLTSRRVRFDHVDQKSTKALEQQINHACKIIDATVMHATTMNATIIYACHKSLMHAAIIDAASLYFTVKR